MGAQNNHDAVLAKIKIKKERKNTVLNTFAKEQAAQ